MKTTETTVQDNKLIAEFMGLKPTEFWGRFSISKDHCTCNDITPEKALEGFASISKYSKDWNWLMPVVEKIDQVGASVIIGRFFCEIGYTDLFDESKNFHVRMASGVKMNAVYSAIVQFINWYNDNK